MEYGRQQTAQHIDRSVKRKNKTSTFKPEQSKTQDYFLADGLGLNETIFSNPEAGGTGCQWSPMHATIMLLSSVS
eukprot:scaffold698377_cov67-Attheya_sp.AAC.3